MRDAEFGWRPAGQDRDGVFELGALHADSKRQRLDIVDLGLGQRHVGAGGAGGAGRTVAGFEFVLGDPIGLAILGGGALEQIVQRVGGAEIEIGGGELRLRR